MTMPNHALSIVPVVSVLYAPDYLAAPRPDRLVDYERGGIALSDPSQGLLVQDWMIHYEDPDVIITPMTSGSPTVSFSKAGLTELNLAFDQNMNEFVAYVADGEAWYYWYDPVPANYVHVQMAADVIEPRCCMDDKRLQMVDTSDIILAYIRGSSLYTREQRDRFTVEYFQMNDVPGSFETIGMARNNRLHFAFSNPGIQSGPPILPIPYYTHYISGQYGYLNIDGLSEVSFFSVFGYEVDGVDFNAVFATLGTHANPKLIHINTLDGANRIQWVQDGSFTEGFMALIDENNYFWDSLGYYNQVVPEQNYIDIPSGIDCWLVTATDTGSGKVRKWDQDDVIDPDPPPDPPDPDPDLTGAIPWTSYFQHPFGSAAYEQVMRFIPAAGVSIWFQVPLSLPNKNLSIVSVEVAGVTLVNRQGALNTDVGNYVDGATFTWGLGGGIKVDIGGTGWGQSQMTLVKGNTYILNMKNVPANPPNQNLMTIQFNLTNP